MTTSLQEYFSKLGGFPISSLQHNKSSLGLRTSLTFEGPLDLGESFDWKFEYDSKVFTCKGCKIRRVKYDHRVDITCSDYQIHDIMGNLLFKSVPLKERLLDFFLPYRHRS